MPSSGIRLERGFSVAIEAELYVIENRDAISESLLSTGFWTGMDFGGLLPGHRPVLNTGIIENVGVAHRATRACRDLGERP